MPKLTKKQFEEVFREEVLPYVIKGERAGVPDKPARRTAWNDTVDSYMRDGRLPESAGDWGHPRWLETYRSRGSSHATKAAPKSQRAMYDEASRKSAEINETFLEMLPTMRRRDLEKLIEKRPALWGRFAGYLKSGHVFVDDQPAKTRHHAAMKSRAKPKRTRESPISDDQAVEIASAWHSVMTWNDPGVTMYSVSSTGRVHSEKHRKQLLAYIEKSIPQAQALDDRGETGVVTESNVADLEALRDWAKAFKLKGDTGRTTPHHHATMPKVPKSASQLDREIAEIVGPSGAYKAALKLSRPSKSHAHAAVAKPYAPKPSLTVRQINALVRAADGRNIYLVRDRMGDQTVQRITRARTKGRETEVRVLATGNWLPVLPERGDRLEIR